MYTLRLLSLCLLSWTGVMGQHNHADVEEEKKIKLGDTVVLPCNVFQSENFTTVHWLYIIPKAQAEDLKTLYTASPNEIVPQEDPMKDRVDLKNNYELLIKDVKVQDNKMFMCRVEYKNGVRKESRMQLSVYKAPSDPEIEMEKDGVQIKEDAVKIGTCESNNGSPLPNITWYKNNMPLKQGQDGVEVSTLVTTESSGLITVRSILYTPVKTSDVDAVFYCDVSYYLPRGLYMKESERKNITVYYSTTEIKLYIKSPSAMIKEGDIVKLICYGNGNPQPTYTLSREDETVLAEDSPYSWKVSRRDSGKYICKSLDMNSFTELEAHNSLHVNFLDTPVLSYGPSVSVDFGSSLIVYCQANASAHALFQWKKEGIIIANGSVLHLDFVEYNTRGFYTCVVDIPTVQGLTKSSGIQVTVQGIPKVSVTSQVVEGQINKTVIASCKAIGYPLPQITWYMNNKEVVSQILISNISDWEVTSELTILVNNEPIENLTCIASNELNRSISYAYLLENMQKEKTKQTAGYRRDFNPVEDQMVVTLPMVTKVPVPDPESRKLKKHGAVIAIVIFCILALAVLGAFLYFLYKKGHIPCGHSAKKDINVFRTKSGSKDQIAVEMTTEPPAEESVLLRGNQDKKLSADQEKYKI